MPRLRMGHRSIRACRRAHRAGWAVNIAAPPPSLHFCSSHATAPHPGHSWTSLGCHVTHRTSTYPAVSYAQCSQLWRSHKDMTIWSQLSRMPRSTSARITQHSKRETHPLARKPQNSSQIGQKWPMQEKRSAQFGPTAAAWWFDHFTLPSLWSPSTNTSLTSSVLCLPLTFHTIPLLPGFRLTTHPSTPGTVLQGPPPSLPLLCPHWWGCSGQSLWPQREINCVQTGPCNSSSNPCLTALASFKPLPGPWVCSDYGFPPSATSTLSSASSPSLLCCSWTAQVTHSPPKGFVWERTTKNPPNQNCRGKLGIHNKKKWKKKRQECSNTSLIQNVCGKESI